MEGEDFYNDDLNIDGMEEKEELPGDLDRMMEDWRNKRFNGQPVSTKYWTPNGTKFQGQKNCLISGWHQREISSASMNNHTRTFQLDKNSYLLIPVLTDNIVYHLKDSFIVLTFNFEAFNFMFDLLSH